MALLVHEAPGRIEALGPAAHLFLLLHEAFHLPAHRCLAVGQAGFGRGQPRPLGLELAILVVAPTPEVLLGRQAYFGLEGLGIATCPVGLLALAHRQLGTQGPLAEAVDGIGDAGARERPSHRKQPGFSGHASLGARGRKPTTGWDDHPVQTEIVILPGDPRQQLSVEGDPEGPATERLQQPVVEPLPPTEPDPIL